MKIICDNCRTKYSIADEKVRGKVFKIRCKKCQNIIVVRGTQSQRVEEGEPGQGTDFAPGPGTAAGPEETPVWHLVIDREQVGPMSATEIRDRYARGEINEETYVWREGFANWQRLASTEEFAEIAQATKVASPSVAMPPAEPAPAVGPGPGFHAPSPWEAPRAESPVERAWAPAERSPAAAAGAAAFSPPAGDAAMEPDPARFSHDAAVHDQKRDLFATYHGDDGLAPVDMGSAGQQSASDSGGFSPVGDMFGDSGEPEPARGDVVVHPAQRGVSAAMKGARNENSVLFSLSNLQDLALGKKPGPGPSVEGSAGAGDGSGLIDIRSMATGLAPSRPADTGSVLDDIPLGSFASPVAAAPVLMPTADDEKPRWVLPVVIGMGCVLLGLVGLVVFLLVRPSVPPALVAANVTAKESPRPGPAPAPAEANTPAAGEPASKSAEERTGDKTADPASATEKPAGQPAPPPAEAKAPESRPDKSRAGRRPRKGARRGGRAAAAGTPARASEPEPARGAAARPGSDPKKPRRRDSLDDLIDGALTGGGERKAKAPRKAAAPAENLPETLTKAQIQSGMKDTRSKVQSCYDRFKVPGLARVQLSISPNGHVGSAQVKGVFAGTPTGDCVERAAKAASFPKFRGTALTITYPFILR